VPDQGWRAGFNILDHDLEQACGQRVGHLAREASVALDIYLRIVELRVRNRGEGLPSNRSVKLPQGSPCILREFYMVSGASIDDHALRLDLDSGR
jgi:hypothetical protein